MFQRAQLIAGSGGELGIQSKYLDCECDLVGYALAGAVAAGEQFKVFRSVVLSIAVDVVHRFFLEQFTAKSFRHYVAMFHDCVLLTGHQRWHGNPDVAMAFDVSTKIPAFEFSQSTFFYKFVSACWRAVFLLVVEASSWFTAFRESLLAVRARKSIAGIGVFSLPGTRAFSRAVQRIASVFFVVFSKVRLQHAERLAAFPASKSNLLSPWCRSDRFEPKRRSALQATKSLVRAWIAKKRLSTLFARFFETHVLTPVFDRAVSMDVRLGIVK